MTFRLVAKCLNQLRYRVPSSDIYTCIFIHMRHMYTRIYTQIIFWILYSHGCNYEVTIFWDMTPCSRVLIHQMFQRNFF
jgi:hypothetical protein